MALPTQRHTSSRKKIRNAAHTLRTKQVSKCKNCGAAILPHRACKKCGHYKGSKKIK